MSKSEQEAFTLGYHAGTLEAATFAGMLLAALGFCLTVSLPVISLPLRSLLKPYVDAKVESGRATIIAIQRFQHPVLSTLHTIASYTCGVDFYIVCLPLLFWIGFQHISRQLVLLLALSVYVGNALKDMVCSDRPDWSKGVKLVGADPNTTKGAHLEYGLPSTHTINTIVMTMYVIHFYNFYGPGGGLWLHQNLLYRNFQVALVLGTLWCLFVMHGRLYLGMHSPIDVIVGVLVAIGILVFWILIEDFVDAWVLHGEYVAVTQTILAVVQICCYPTPERRTPSHNYVVYFVGSALGIIIGVSTSPQYHTTQASQKILEHMLPLSLHTIVFVLRRTIVGMLVVLVARYLTKFASLFLVRLVCNMLGIKFSDHDKFYEQLEMKGEAITKRPPGFNVNTPVRLMTYTVVGWTACAHCFWAFDYVGV